MNNLALIKGLELNNIDNETITKILSIKFTAEELGWDMDSYDGMDGKIYVTFSIDNKAKNENNNAL